MDLEGDLRKILLSQFDEHGVSYDPGLEFGELVLRYLEMVNRRISKVPRQVCFSDEIHASLGRLSETGADNSQNGEKKKDAWRAVFLLRHRFVEGENVNGFLSKRIAYATGPQSKDGLLWDFGMHHLHLSTKRTESGFVERSDYLLFAIVTDETAYFVDVRPHSDPQGLLWVRQDLLKVVESNWPELIEPNVLKGILPGTPRSDEERKALRESNTVCAVEMDGAVAVPLGGGTTTDGSSLMCRVRASQLLREVRKHQELFESHASEIASRLKENGIDRSGKPELRMALLDSLELDANVVTALKADNCLSKNLCHMGLVVVERNSRTPVTIFLKE